VPICLIESSFELLNAQKQICNSFDSLLFLRPGKEGELFIEARMTEWFSCTRLDSTRIDDEGGGDEAIERRCRE